MTPTSKVPTKPARPVPPPPGSDATLPAPALPIFAKRWKRADKVAASAVLVAVASLTVAILAYVDTRRANQSSDQTSQKALRIAQQADARSQTTDRTTFEAMVMLIDERVNQIVDATEDGGWQLEGIARGTSDDLLIRPNKKSLAFIDQLAGRIPSLDLSVEQITSLSKGPQSIAATTTQCVRMRDQLVMDLQGYRGATMQGSTVKGLDQHQVLAFPVLPDRIRHVHEACRGAAQQLTALIPNQFKGGMARGTLGELMDAQSEALQERLEEAKDKKPSAY